MRRLITILFLLITISGFGQYEKILNGKNVNPYNLILKNKFIWEGKEVVRDSLVYAEIQTGAIRFRYFDGSWTDYYQLNEDLSGIRDTLVWMADSITSYDLRLQVLEGFNETDPEFYLWLNNVSFQDSILTYQTDNQSLSIDSMGRIFTISIENSNSVTFEDTNSEYDLSGYATRSELGDTANIVRSEIPTLLTELDSSEFRITENQISDLDHFTNSDETDTIALDSINNQLRPDINLNISHRINDNDLSATNEIQTISKIGSTVTLSDGGGSFTDEVNDADADITNELQTIDTFRFVNNVLELSILNDGEIKKTVDLSSLDNSGTDNQTLSTNGNPGVIAIENGNSIIVNVDDADASSTNEIQDISTTGAAGNISISDGSILNLNVNDADASISNEIQSISLDANILSISNDISTVDLSGYLDNTDNQQLSIDSTNRVFTIALENGGNVKFEDRNFTGEYNDLLNRPILMDNSNEADPLFKDWNRTEGINIWSKQIFDWDEKLEPFALESDITGGVLDADFTSLAINGTDLSIILNDTANNVRAEIPWSDGTFGYKADTKNLEIYNTSPKLYFNDSGTPQYYYFELMDNKLQLNAYDDDLGSYALSSPLGINQTGIIPVGIYDKNNTRGTNGQLLSSSSGNIEWVDAPSGTVTSVGVSSSDFIVSGSPITTNGTITLNLDNDAIANQTALTSGLVSTDELLVSDAGLLKRMDVSVLQTYMQNNLSFDGGTGLWTASGSDIYYSLGEVRIGNNIDHGAYDLQIEGEVFVNSYVDALWYKSEYGLQFSPVASPLGNHMIYVNSSNNNLYFRNGSGNEYDLLQTATYSTQGRAAFDETDFYIYNGLVQDKMEWRTNGSFIASGTTQTISLIGVGSFEYYGKLSIMVVDTNSDNFSSYTAYASADMDSGTFKRTRITVEDDDTPVINISYSWVDNGTNGSLNINISGLVDGHTYEYSYKSETIRFENK